MEEGDQTVALLERYAALRPDDRVLDVGCDLGRVAWPLAQRLDPRGTYDGFDVVRAYIDWSLANLGLDPSRFRFRHVDVRSRFYNPEGTIAAEDFVFPWAEATFDLAIATSLFTHLVPSTIERYLGEIVRTLAPAGRLFATFFLLDDGIRGPAREGITYPAFSHPIEHGLVHDVAVPEVAVALEDHWVLGRLAAAGLSAAEVYRGRWRGAAGPSYQDVVVATRR